MVDAEQRSKQPLDDAPARPGRGKTLWSILLVLDSFLVIIFGGALAAKLYQHWQGPPPTAARRPRPVTKPAPQDAAKPEAKPEPPKAPEPPKPEPAKPAAKEPTPAPNSPRPPKPSLLHEAPKREAAKPQGAAASSAAPASAPAAGVQKAVPTEFHYKGSAKHVELVGAFIVRGGRKSMVESAPGMWTLTLYLTPNTYRYHFFVNGKKVLDPDNAKQDRGMSVLTVAPSQP